MFLHHLPMVSVHHYCNIVKGTFFDDVALHMYRFCSEICFMIADSLGYVYFWHFKAATLYSQTGNRLGLVPRHVAP